MAPLLIFWDCALIEDAFSIAPDLLMVDAAVNTQFCSKQCCRKY